MARRYHPDLNPGCEISARKFQTGASAIKTIRETGLAHNQLRSPDVASMHTPRDGYYKTPEFRYGAHFSTTTNSRRFRHGALFSRNQKTVLGIGSILLVGVAITKLSYESSSRDDAYEKWLASEETRKRERNSRPMLGKGRRNPTRDNSSYSHLR